MNTEDHEVWMREAMLVVIGMISTVMLDPGEERLRGLRMMEANVEVLSSRHRGVDLEN